MDQAEIAGYMDWRGPGAYTERQMVKIQRIIQEVRRRERGAMRHEVHSCGPSCTNAACVAVREAVEPEKKRADALAATIAALRDIVTSETESKADFIARVRELLGADPDQRVLSAVLAERAAIKERVMFLTLDYNYKSDAYYRGWLDMRDLAVEVIEPKVTP